MKSCDWEVSYFISVPAIGSSVGWLRSIPTSQILGGITAGSTGRNRTLTVRWGHSCRQKTAQ